MQPNIEKRVVIVLYIDGNDGCSNMLYADDGPEGSAYKIALMAKINRDRPYWPLCISLFSGSFLCAQPDPE